jgi:hypothetical protein
MVIKGRERIIRGKINNFTDLPVDKQEVFKKIKQIINEVGVKVDIMFNKNNTGYVLIL